MFLHVVFSKCCPAKSNKDALFMYILFYSDWDLVKTFNNMSCYNLQHTLYLFKHRCLDSGLQYRYQASWAAILEVIRVTFEVMHGFTPWTVYCCQDKRCLSFSFCSFFQIFCDMSCWVMTSFLIIMNIHEVCHSNFQVLGKHCPKLLKKVSFSTVVVTFFIHLFLPDITVHLSFHLFVCPSLFLSSTLLVVTFDVCTRFTI